MNIFDRITLRTMKENRTRTMVSIVGVILVTSMITAVITFGFSFQNFMIEHAIKVDGNWHVFEKAVSEEEYQSVKEDSEVETCAAIRELGFGRMSTREAENSQGIAPYLYLQTMNQEAADVLSVKLSQGRLPENENEIILQKRDLELYNEKTGVSEQVLNIGDEIKVTVGDCVIDGVKQTGNVWFTEDLNDPYKFFKPRYERSYTIVGILEHWGNSNSGGSGNDAFTGEIKEEDHLKEDQEAPYNVYIRLDDPKNVQSFVDTIEEGTEFWTNESILKWTGGSMNVAYMRVLNGVIEVLIFIIGVGSVALIYNTFAISLREKTSHLGILSSTGATNKQLRRSMWCESFIVGITGIPLGIIAGIGGTAVTLHFIGPWIGEYVNGEEEVLKLYISPAVILSTILVVFVIICLSVWVPVRRTRKITPMDAIRQTKDIKIRPQVVKSPGIILKLFGTEGMLADKNYRRDRKKYRATVFSLTISIILFVSASLLSSYLIHTGYFVAAVPKYEIECNYYSDLAESDSKKIEKIVKDTEKIQDYKMYEEQYAVFRDGSEEKEIKLICIPDEEFEAYVKSDSKEPVYYDKCMVYDANLEKYVEERVLGGKDNLTINVQKYTSVYDEKNDEWKEEGSDILPITTRKSMDDLPDYINSYDSTVYIIIPESRREEYQFKEDKFSSFSKTIKIKASEHNQVYKELEEKREKENLADYVRIYDWAQSYERQRGMVMSVEVLTYGFIVLISLIAAANVFNTISTNVMVRKREFAVLQSMGMSQKMLRKMMNYECIIYGLRSIVYGVTGSLLISLLLYVKIQRGVDIDFINPWLPLLTAMIWVMIVVFCTMLYSIQKVKKQNIIEELRRD